MTSATTTGATTTGPTSTGPASTRPTSTAKGRPPRKSRRWIWWVVGAVVLLLVLIAASFGIAALGDSVRPTNTTPLEPRNSSATGTSALTAIIDDHGVDVKVVRGLSDLKDTAAPGEDTTVVITRSSILNSTTAEQFLDRVRGAHRVVVIDPSGSALDLLDLPVTTSYVVGEHTSTVRAGCTVAGISADDVVSTDAQSGFRPTAYGLLELATTCFASSSPGEGGQMVIVPANDRAPEVVVMTSAMATNANLGINDNAGVSVRTIANSDRVLWYIPQPGDQRPPDDDEGPSILPKAVGPLFFLAFFALIALMIWRGRRFGPLATEPLPAVVKAIETTQSRGRMYRHARASGRAAAVLRIHTLENLAGYLGLPYDPGRAMDALADDRPPAPDPAVAAIISAVAAATHRDPARVGALLAGPPPVGDDALLSFTTELTALEKEVRRTP